MAVGILGLGFFGPHVAPAPDASTAISTASTGPSAGVAAAPTSHPTAPSPLRDDPEQIESLTGLRLFDQTPSELVTWLPVPITSVSPSAVGRRLFYVVGGDRIETLLLGSKAQPKVLVAVPHCQAINALSAAGTSLIYVVTAPVPPMATMGGCDSFAQLSWSLRLMNLASGKVRELAGGVRETSGFAQVPVHFAMTKDSYAFDRADAASPDGGGTVEVHALDGRLLWSTTTKTGVEDVLLGGDRVAVVTGGISGQPGNRTLWSADASDRTLREVAPIAWSASLSDDGRYLAWDFNQQIGLTTASAVADIAIRDTVGGKVTFLDPPTTAMPLAPTNPKVLITANGPLATWFVTAPDAIVYPAFRWLRSGDSGFLMSVQQPIWIGVDGNSLMWLAEGSDGWSAVVFAVPIRGF